jgi:hypothetical protein
LNTDITRRRRGPKVSYYHIGPMRVVNSVGSKYILQDLVTKKNKDYHVLD